MIGAAGMIVDTSKILGGRMGISVDRFEVIGANVIKVALGTDREEGM